MAEMSRWRRRAAVTLAACVAAVGVPLATTSLSASAAACVAPTQLFADDALRGNVSNTTGLLDPRLTWTAIAGVASYEVQISPNEDFTNNIQADVSTVANRYDVPRGLLKPISYFWRVRVAGAACWSDDGATRASQFNAGIIPAPVQLSPADGATVAPAALALRWAPVTEASAYDVRVTNAETGELIGDCLTDHTSWSPSDEIVDGTAEPGDCLKLTQLGDNLSYDWQVVALDGTSALPSSQTYAYRGIGISSGAPLTRQTPPLEISSLSTSEGPTTGGTSFTVTGVNFNNTATVSIGGSQAPTTTYVDGQHLDVVSPLFQKHGDTNVTVTECASGCGTSNEVDVTSSASPSSAWRYTDGVYDTPPTFAAPAGTTIGLWSPVRSFLTGTAAPLGGSPSGQPTGLTATDYDANGNPSVVCSMTTSCSDTPTLSWSAVSGATSYRLTLAEGTTVAGATNTVATYETTATSITPRSDLLDNQSGDAYFWTVQSCTESGCATGSLGWANFLKRSTPVVVTGPLDAATVQYYNVVLSWREWQSTAGVAMAPQGYHVQIATDCLFTRLTDDRATDFPEFVSTNTTYPDGTYYWRVQAVDQSGNGLTWSTPNRDTTTCTSVPSFTLHKSISGTTSVGSQSAAAASHLVESGSKPATHAGLWLARRAAKAHGGTALVTTGKKKERVDLTFTGTQVVVSYCTGPADGWFQLYIDNKSVNKYNTYRSFTTCGSTITVRNLKAGVKHSVRVMALGKKGTSRKGGNTQVVVDYLLYQ